VHGAHRGLIFSRQKARFPIFAEYERTLARTIPVIRLDPRQARHGEEERKEAG
jgi:hypothetical protein